MIQKDEIPSEFRNTTFHKIYEGKGKGEELSKNRFIYSKSWFPTLVEGLVVEGALKKPLVEKSSIFQIGVQPNHRPYILARRTLLCHFKMGEHLAKYGALHLI